MVFSVIWLAEALKLHAFGVREYFSYAWNRFDFFLVFCSLSEVLLVAATAGHGRFDARLVGSPPYSPRASRAPRPGHQASWRCGRCSPR